MAKEPKKLIANNKKEGLSRLLFCLRNTKPVFHLQELR